VVRRIAGINHTPATPVTDKHIMSEPGPIAIDDVALRSLGVIAVQSARVVPVLVGLRSSLDRSKSHEAHLSNRIVDEHGGVQSHQRPSGSRHDFSQDELTALGRDLGVRVALGPVTWCVALLLDEGHIDWLSDGQ